MKSIFLLLCISILSLTTAAMAADEVKLAVVDLPKVLHESEVGKKGTAVLKELYDKYQAEISAKGKELERLQKALVEKGNSLSAAKRSAKEKDLKKKFQAYEAFGKNAEQEISKKQSELLNSIMDGLEKLVKDYGRTNGYAAIASKGSLIYNDSKYGIHDVTEEILKQFDAAGKK